MASIFSSLIGILSGTKPGERDDSSDWEEEESPGGEVPEQSPTTAAQWRERARKGEAEAQYQLGECLYYGRGVPENRTEAASWYLKAARQGHTEAQYSLGLCFELGEGAPQDARKAAGWHRMAAVSGHAGAWAHLAGLYAEGKGVHRQDLEMAARL